MGEARVGKGIIAQELADAAHEDATGGNVTPQIGCLVGAALHGLEPESERSTDTDPSEPIDDNPCVIKGLD